MKTRGIPFTVILMLFSLAQVFIACDADTEVDKTVDEILAAQPTIESISPGSADILSKVTISGTFLNFAEKAYIGDVECQISQRINGETLEIEVASNATSGIVKIITSAGKEAVSSESLTVTYPTPSVTSTLPSSGTVNENIIIEGTNLTSITRVSFGGVDGTIQFQEDQAIVVSIPNNESSPVEVTYDYNSASGNITEVLGSNFNILIPTPIISAWPELMNRDSEVTIVGTDMNLITGVNVGGQAVTLNTASATSVSFKVPSSVPTGYQDIVIDYGTSKHLTQPSVPYINGQFESYIEFDSYSEDVFSIYPTKDPGVSHQLNGDVEQPPFPGSSYYSLTMTTATGSTIARMKLNSATNNDTWPNMIDAGNFGNNPVLHFWLNTENTESFIKFYIGGTSNDFRRQIGGSDSNTGNAWKLCAVRLKDFIPGLTSIGSAFEIRISTGSSAPVLPAKINLDWIIVTDSVLTELGAVDITDLFGPTG